VTGEQTSSQQTSRRADEFEAGQQTSSKQSREPRLSPTRLLPTRLLLTRLLALLVFVGALAVFGERAERVGYNTDEGQAMWPSQYFQFVFLDHQLGSPVWDENYWTLTQVPVYRYIIGAGIWLGGQSFTPLDLDFRSDEVRGPNRARYFDPRTYDDERKLAEQRRVPRPSADALKAARRPMVLLGAGAAAMLFLVGCELAGIVAGLVAAIGFVAAPFVLTLMPRAHTEAPFIFFMLLALWLSSRAVRSPRPLLLGALAGLAAGLSAGSKLTGVLELAALGAFAAGAFGLTLLVRLPAVAAWIGPRHSFVRAGQWSALAAIVGLVVFLAVNPLLWSNPIGRVQAMLAFRQQEMFGQRTLNAELATPESTVGRAVLLLRQSFVGEMPLARRTGLPVEAAFAVGGLVVLGWRIVRTRQAGGLVGAEAMLLVWLLVFVVGTAPNLGIDWDRYYLPTVALGLLLAGVGAEVGVGAIVGAVRRGVGSRAASQDTPSASAATPPPIPTARSGSAG
jgi:hypothetical protein